MIKDLTYLKKYPGNIRVSGKITLSPSIYFRLDRDNNDSILNKSIELNVKR